MATFWEGLRQLNAVAWVMVMIIVVVAIQGVVSIVKLRHKHRERMAMIKRGMYPDAAGPAEERDDEGEEEGEDEE